jgi:hypothetical protein
MRLWIFAIALLLGCRAAQSGPAVGADSERFTQTVVYLNGADAPQVSLREIMAGEQRRRNGANPEAINQDPGCAGASLWLWDLPNQTGDDPEPSMGRLSNPESFFVPRASRHISG